MQEETRRHLCLLLREYGMIENHRPSWLRNPATGANMEIDLYLPVVKIGIEVQGKQHREYVPFFHRTEAAFREQQKRDALKKQLCTNNGVYLFEVCQESDLSHFLETVHGHDSRMYGALLNKGQAMTAMAYLAAKAWQCRRNPDQLSSVLHKLTHLADKYSIALKDIKPDFTIRKAEIAFWGHKVVKAYSYAPDDEIHDSERVGVIATDEGARIITVRFWRCLGHTKKDFNLDSLWETEHDDTDYRWKLRQETLPEEIMALQQRHMPRLDNAAVLGRAIPL